MASGPSVVAALKDLWRRVAMLVARAVITRVSDAGGRQVLQTEILAGEVRDDFERFAETGFFSVPLAGAGAVVLSIAGDRSHAVVVATDDRRHRPRGGAPGDAGLYHPLDDPSKSAEESLHRWTLTDRGGVRTAIGRFDRLDIKCGSSSLLVEDGRIRLEADVIETHAREKIKWDVNGYGEDWIYVDGADQYHEDTYKIDPIRVVAGGAFNVNDPEH